MKPVKVSQALKLLQSKGLEDGVVIQLEATDLVIDVPDLIDNPNSIAMLTSSYAVIKTPNGKHYYMLPKRHRDEYVGERYTGGRQLITAGLGYTMIKNRRK